MEKRQRTLKGYTLLEVIVAIAVFSIIMLAIVQVFGTTFIGYRETKKLQRNLETAQFATNTMAKELRTSSLLSTSGSPLNVRFIDYSQNGGRGTCILYQVNSSGQLRKWSRNMNNSDLDQNRSDCDSVSFTGSDDNGVLLENIQASGTTVVDSKNSPRRVGKITIFLRVGSEAYNDTLQTTVSLRDFNYVDI